MEFRYSEEIVPEPDETYGLESAIPFRLHKDPFKERDGAIRAQKDWSHHVKPVMGYRGSLGGVRTASPGLPFLNAFQIGSSSFRTPLSSNFYMMVGGI